MRKKFTPEEQKQKKLIYDAEYRIKNKEKLKLKQKQNYLENKDIFAKRSKKWQEKNKEKIREQRKEYWDKNKELINQKRKDKTKSKIKKVKKSLEQLKEYRKQYYLANKEKLKQYHKDYRIKNKHTLEQKQKRNLRIKERKATEPLFKIKTNIRSLIGQTIRNKGYKKSLKSEQILGCSYDEFKQHIESQLESWMSWDNYGNPKDKVFEPNKTWDIDHIIPIETAITEDDVIKLNHYTNLRPLCSYYNRWVKKNQR